MLNTEVFQKPNGEWTYYITYHSGRNAGTRLLVGGLLKYRLPEDAAEPTSEKECRMLAKIERDEITRLLRQDPNRFTPSYLLES